MVESVNHHVTRLASSDSEIHQTTQKKVIEALTAQLQQLTDVVSQMSASDPSAVPSSVRTTSSIFAPGPRMGSLEC